MKPITYHIWWADHKLERGPVPADDAANIIVHHLRTFPDDPVWLMPTALCPRSVLEAHLISEIGRLRKHIEGLAAPADGFDRRMHQVLKDLLRAAVEVVIEADEQKMARMMKRIDDTIPIGKPQEGG